MYWCVGGTHPVVGRVGWSNETLASRVPMQSHPPVRPLPPLHLGCSHPPPPPTIIFYPPYHHPPSFFTHPPLPTASGLSLSQHSDVWAVVAHTHVLAVGLGWH